MRTADIEYGDGTLTCRGFLAYDEDAETGRRPGVLVVHEAFGLGKPAMDRAKMLADLGYVAFAADMFGDRKQVTELPKAIEIITDLLSNPPKLLARAGAALEVLASAARGRRRATWWDRLLFRRLAPCCSSRAAAWTSRRGQLPRAGSRQRSQPRLCNRQGGGPRLYRGGTIR